MVPSVVSEQFSLDFQKVLSPLPLALWFGRARLAFALFSSRQKKSRFPKVKK